MTRYHLNLINEFRTQKKNFSLLFLIEHKTGTFKFSQRRFGDERQQENVANLFIFHGSINRKQNKKKMQTN